ncbi:MAG: hypothetical protein KGD63_00655 [Candidatus Lokiarchaeota archaeon]|nr:hypothetical protein [Candidatus Lokiarchaeota archaeon]
MNEENSNGEIAELSFLAGKGNYVKEVIYIYESDDAVKLGRKKDSKILWIPKSIIRGGWKKEVDVIQNIFIKDFVSHFKYIWKKG